MAMETILGIKGIDFVMLASDTMQAKSLIFMKDGKYRYLFWSHYTLIAKTKILFKLLQIANSKIWRRQSSNSESVMPGIIS